MTNPNELWNSALDDLQTQMARATFDTNLRGSNAIGLEGDVLTIAVKNPQAVGWLSNRLAPVIARAVSRCAGQQLSVQFVLMVQEVTAEIPAIAAPEPLMEAVHEEHVSVHPGGALVWTDFYIKLKVAFRRRALGDLKGAPLSVFLCLALHVNKDGVASPGIEAIMRETKYSRPAVCSALDDLEKLGLITKRTIHHGANEYSVLGYAWLGQKPAPALLEGSHS